MFTLYWERKAYEQGNCGKSCNGIYEKSATHFWGGAIMEIHLDYGKGALRWWDLSVALKEGWNFERMIQYREDGHFIPYRS